tara:strand:- start:89 stop:346 length:258 start_codon:yes stop_codon:yes gene_type:complete
MEVVNNAFQSVLPFNLGIQEHVQKMKETQEVVSNRLEKRLIETSHNKAHRAEALFEQQQLADKFSYDRLQIKKYAEQGQLVDVEV